MKTKINKNPNNLLWKGVKKGRLDIVIEAIKLGGKPSDLVKEDLYFCGDYEGTLITSPLHCAIKEKKTDIALYLIANAKELEGMDHDGYTPLHMAAKNNLLQVVEALINSKVNLNSVSKGGYTPLHLAAEAGNSEITETLIRNSANVNDDNLYNKLTPLFCAIDEGHIQIVEILLNNGAVLNRKDGWGRTPLQIATSKNNIELIILLLERGADIDDKIAKITDKPWSDLIKAVLDCDMYLYNSKENEVYDVLKEPHDAYKPEIAKRLIFRLEDLHKHNQLLKAKELLARANKLDFFKSYVEKKVDKIVETHETLLCLNKATDSPVKFLPKDILLKVMKFVDEHGLLDNIAPYPEEKSMSESYLSSDNQLLGEDITTNHD